MSQVHISGANHTVMVTHDGGDLTYVIEKAQKLWDDTKPPERGPGPAVGFQAEREYRRGGFEWNMGAGGQPVVAP
jgi:hypothetical protein